MFSVHSYYFLKARLAHIFIIEVYVIDLKLWIIAQITRFGKISNFNEEKLRCNRIVIYRTGHVGFQAVSWFCRCQYQCHDAVWNNTWHKHSLWIPFCIVNIVRYLRVIIEFLRDIARMRGDEWQIRIPVQNPCTYSTIVINNYNETYGVHPDSLNIPM